MLNKYVMLQHKLINKFVLGFFPPPQSQAASFWIFSDLVACVFQEIWQH